MPCRPVPTQPLSGPTPAGTLPNPLAGRLLADASAAAAQFSESLRLVLRVASTPAKKVRPPHARAGHGAWHTYAYTSHSVTERGDPLRAAECVHAVPTSVQGMVDEDLAALLLRLNYNGMYEQQLTAYAEASAVGHSIRPGLLPAAPAAPAGRRSSSGHA